MNPPETAGIQPMIFVLAGVAFFLLLWVIVTFNRFVRLSNLIRESWADVDVALKRRYDLIPNLVETVRAYAKHESDLFEKISAAREQAIHSVGQVARQASDQQELEGSLHLLLARAEAYPELKASAHYMRLQEELANTEDRIAAARRFYNANVRTYNTLLQAFPSSILASGRALAEFFEVGRVEDSEPIRVSIGR